ncbi:MAG: NADH-quinone oxidoreductase subunit H [Planctomycetes bacterium]|nr:NADH-quinone oxidoreductase subunit H [Planctomycetota bacterium]
MNIGLLLLVFLAAALGTQALGLALRWVDRKVTARVQYRVGPPFFQPVFDVLKLMGKENLMPATAVGTGFLLAPVVALASTGVAAAILWAAVFQPTATFLGDLIVVVYLLTIPATMTILGGAASGNPHAAVGASREMKLLLGYELPLVLAILVAVAHNGWTLKLGDLATFQQMHGSTVLSFSGLLAFLVAILCMHAKLGQVPFDVAEAECEIMSGVYVEYSGPSLACWHLTRAMLLALLPLLLIVVFWGGLDTSVWWDWPAFLAKYVLLVALVTVLRNTNPRLRIDQTVKFFWFVLTPVAIVAAALAAIGVSENLSWL